jgi:hypothetical protein
MIPFVSALGDELERAIAARRRRVRRRIGIGALSFAVAATGVAAASGVFNTPEQLAGTSVGCYDRASLDANVSVLSTGADTPVDTCRRVLGVDGPLVACANGAVAVFPGGPGTCERLGLEPLPPEYDAARAKVLAFADAVRAIETSEECVPPRELARRVQALLDRSGWTGWKTWLRLDLDRGPCGSVTGVGGDGSRTIEGALDTEGRRVIVSPSATPALVKLLYEDNLGGRLMDASGARCYTRATLEAMVGERLARTGRSVRYEAFSSEGEPYDARGRRLREGCAVIAGVRPDSDGRGIVVEVQG